jgi:hypothetical protein
MPKMRELDWDKILVTGAMIVFIYGIWSTRYVVNKMDIEGSHISKQNAAAIIELKIGQQAIIETLGVVKLNNALIEENHKLLLELNRERNN